MNRLSIEDRCHVVKALVEGNSLRATARMTGVARMTVDKLLRDLGGACIRHQDGQLRNLRCNRIQCDAIWSFVRAKQKNLPLNKQGRPEFSGVWTWVAVDADSKLVVSWLVSDRDAATAFAFMDDVASRLSHRVHLTTDGHRVYLDAVEKGFGSEVDYSMLVKIYGHNDEPDTKYSSAERIDCRAVEVTSLTNAVSKKVENHAQSLALHFTYYNFARIHQTTRITPAMAVGVTDRLWGVEDIVRLLSN